MSASIADHQAWMRVALSLARRGLGRVAPNPAVGCVLVKDGIVVGRGWTQPGGRPHAETEAIKQAGAAARGATAYVSLEPCAHTGQTGPCAVALVASGIARAVVAVGDPDPRVSGQGNAILEAAGIPVTQGVLETEAKELNRGFMTRVTEGRPAFTLKSATSIDGVIALANGDSKWITGPEARAFGHKLRAQHDAIMIGVGTVLADDPSLTCRLPGLETRSPVRIILDSALRTPPGAKLVRSCNAAQKTIIVTARGVDQTPFAATDVEFVTLDDPRDSAAVARALGDQGINSVLIEGGAGVAASFLRAGLVDEIAHFSAGKVIGSDGHGAIGQLGLADLRAAPHFTLKAIRRIGADMLATYVKAE